MVWWKRDGKARQPEEPLPEPLEECPKCHIAPEVKQNVVEGQAFLQCPKCLEAVCGDAPVAVKFKWNRRCRRRQAAKLKAARQARLLERVIGEDVD